MEKIHTGWLVKSPPEWKKHISFFKLKKWRRRYFVLYSPPLACIIPGTCDAQLCYYENETLSKECGRIDLKNCQEITCQLETDDYKNVLALETVCKNQERVYYLAADSENDVETWMNKISYVLNISGDEFIEVNRDKGIKKKVKNSPSRLKLENKSKSENPKNKSSVISLRRCSSTLSKSSTSINILKSTKKVISPGILQNFSNYSKLGSIDNLSPPTFNADPDSSLDRSTNIRTKSSFMNKIKKIKSSTRRPSCPIIIPIQTYFDENYTNSPSTVLRPNTDKQNTLRFQGSSGSSVLSMISDFKTPDVSSPTMPSLFYNALKRYEKNECIIRLENKMSIFSNSSPPPLPPKIRASDSGIPDEASNVFSIYDIPTHNYGANTDINDKMNDADYDDGEEVDAEFIKDRLMELDGLIRFEGICLSVVDEKEDEGLEDDRCPSMDGVVMESIPPPLPDRRRVSPSNDRNSSNSSESDYDILPFASGRVASPKISSSDESDSIYDCLPMTETSLEGQDDEDTAPPLPVRNRKIFKEDYILEEKKSDCILINSSDDVCDHEIKDGDKSPDNVYSYCGDYTKDADDDDDINDNDNLNDDDDDDAVDDDHVNDDKDDGDDDHVNDDKDDGDDHHVDDDKQIIILGEDDHILKAVNQFENYLYITYRPLLREKSKSLDVLPTEYSNDEKTNTISKSFIRDIFIRSTFKTRSFKRKSAECKNKTEEVESSLESPSSQVDDIPEPFLFNDSNLY